MNKDYFPLYVKVMNYLLQEIKENYNPGDMIPTQTDIAEQTDTSLITVKRAISELVKEGHLESKPGKGTFVRQPPILDEHTGVSSWTDSISGLGEAPDTAWMNVDTRIPPSHIANILQLKSKDQTVLINRLRTINGEPICLMTNEIPLHLVPGMQDESINRESLYAWIKDKYQLVPATSEEEVYARYANDEEESNLQMSGDIALVITRISYLKDETPFEYSKIVAPASSYRYRSKQINKTLEQGVIEKLLNN